MDGDDAVGRDPGTTEISLARWPSCRAVLGEWASWGAGLDTGNLILARSPGSRTCSSGSFPVRACLLTQLSPTSQRLVRTSRSTIPRLLDRRPYYDSSPPPLLMGPRGRIVSDSDWPIFARVGWVTWAPPGHEYQICLATWGLGLSGEWHDCGLAGWQAPACPTTERAPL